jgi:homoserine O-acetyltransferase
MMLLTTPKSSSLQQLLLNQINRPSSQKRFLTSSSTATIAATKFPPNHTHYQETTLKLDTNHEVHHAIGVVHIPRDLTLVNGSIIPKEIFHVEYSSWGDPSLPTIALFPSMSNSAMPIDSPLDKRKKGSGWWSKVMGYGPEYGLDISKHRVVVGAVLGAPFGSTSPLTKNPLTGKPYGPDFPRITPQDMARTQGALLDTLGIHHVHAVVGGSMGGMQAIHFAAMFPNRYDRFVAIAATAHTSPSTVAVRSIQRSAVRADPSFKHGRYTESAPTAGLRVARMIGTVAYRSRQEFDARFSWLPSQDNSFEVEKYLEHQADKFTQLTSYDANCYLLLSEAMDRMNIGAGLPSFEHGARQILPGKEVMLLSYNTDVLTPPEDLARLASILGANGVKVHYEVLYSMLGHDSFLINSEAPPLNFRLKAFLNAPQSQAVHTVRRLVGEMHDH